MNISRVLFLVAAMFFSLKSSAATTYYACSSSIWDGNGGSTLVLHAGSCSGTATNVDAVTWTTGDILIIQSGVTVTVYNSPSIGVDVTIDVYGRLLFNTGGNPGKLTLTANSSIKLETGSTIACTPDNGVTTQSCSNSDQINIGGFKYKGSACPNGIDCANSFPKPSSMTSGGTVLPVTLVSFDSRMSNSLVELTWSTASEINFDYFSLQRSRDGIVFNEIVQVKGHGTTNEGHSYSYEDKDPVIGRSYYRLTSVDFDNYQETFKVISVSYQGDKRFVLAPNPNDGSNIQLSFNFVNEENGQVTIYDNLGSVVGTYRMSGAGSVNFESTLKSGVYLAKYSSTSFNSIERFMVR